MSCKPSEKQIHLLFRGAADIAAKRKCPFALPFGSIFALARLVVLYIMPGLLSALRSRHARHDRASFQGAIHRTLPPTGLYAISCWIAPPFNPQAIHRTLPSTGLCATSRWIALPLNPRAIHANRPSRAFYSISCWIALYAQCRMSKAFRKQGAV